MDIKFIYDKVKMWVEEFYGKSRWCYTDYFLDDDGYRYFAEQIKTDKDITTDMNNDDIVEHIEEALGKSMTMYEFQQSMGDIH
jgi:hypothetical protein